jgi:hypothetical protein
MNKNVYISHKFPSRPFLRGFAVQELQYVLYLSNAYYFTVLTKLHLVDLVEF